MNKIFLNEIYGNAISTIIALVAILLSYMLVDFMVVRKMSSSRNKRKFRIRSFYIICFLFIFLMARIWVEGFTHLLAVLGLVSAALVITNKETIMNLVGWLIINWRNLFADDDLIQISGYKGYVKSFGILYFSIHEASEKRIGSITGRIIRIPNGLVATNPLINFSQTSHLFEQVFTIIITQDSDVNITVNLMKDLVNQIVSDFYKGKKEFSAKYLTKHHKDIAARIHLDATTYIQPHLEKPAGIKLITQYYCFYQDAEQIQQQIWLAFLASIKSEKHTKLAYEL